MSPDSVVRHSWIDLGVLFGLNEQDGIGFERYVHCLDPSNEGSCARRGIATHQTRTIKVAWIIRKGKHEISGVSQMASTLSARRFENGCDLRKRSTTTILIRRFAPSPQPFR